MAEGNGQKALAQKLSEPDITALLGDILTRLETVREINVATKALWDIQTNTMVERISETLEKTVQVLDRLNQPGVLGVLEKLEKNSTALGHLLDFLPQMEMSGGISALVEIGGAVKAIQNLGVDTLVERVATQIERAGDLMDRFDRLPVAELVDMANRLKENGGLETIPELVGAITAIRRLLTDTLIERVTVIADQAVAWQGNVAYAFRNVRYPEMTPGWGGIFQLIRDPEVQKSLYFFLSAIKSVGTSATKS